MDIGDKVYCKDGIDRFRVGNYHMVEEIYRNGICIIDGVEFRYDNDELEEFYPSFWDYFEICEN